MKRQTKKNIINICGISVMVLFALGVGYLVLFGDPILETEYDTGNPRTTLIVREHTKTGEKDYIYGIVDGVGSVQIEGKPDE